MDLLRRPTEQFGKLINLTPQSAGWKYVGFDLYHLKSGDKIMDTTNDREAMVIILEGKATLSANGIDYGSCGKRMSVFERIPPACLYVTDHSDWQAMAITECQIAVGSAPSMSKHKNQLIDHSNLALTIRGKGANERFIHPLAMEDLDVADHLLITEVYTPSGHWSSYPPHRHDVDDFPTTTYLEETYYHRINPSQGYGFQRVFTEDGTLDQTICVQDRDLVLVPRGHHPFGIAYGYESYYLNIMAGPLRKWRFQNHPDHDWIAKRDSVA